MPSEVENSAGKAKERKENEEKALKTVGLSNQKPLDTHEEASASKPKRGGVEEGGDRLFVNGDLSFKRICDEDRSRCRILANDNERMGRKFCVSYGHLLAFITCTTAQCGEEVCVLKILTKGHDFKENTPDRSRGSVKDTKCGGLTTFGTCLEQWFSLGIIEDLR